ncbi:MAG: hypothetical protein IJV43_07460 [Oscillospiraceae bacterium]|nr:hypothetical protein [Oscillospiraceae bacterium]
MSRELPFCRQAERSIVKKYRRELRTLREGNPNVEKSVFNALHTVNIGTFPSRKSAGEEHSFLER